MSMDNAIKEDILRDYFEAFSNKDVDTLESITAEEFSNRFKKGNLKSVFQRVILKVILNGNFKSKF